jgi:hypothetical protein
MERHQVAQYDFIESLEERLGLQYQWVDTGTLKLLAQIPSVMTGSFFGDYTLKASGRDAEISSDSIVVNYEDMMSSGSLLFKDLGFITVGGEAYMKIGEATGSLADPAFAPIIEKYRSKWISLVDTGLGSWATQEEELAYKFSQNLSKLSIDDARDYSEKYPLWKLVKDNGIIDGYYSYEVELDKENLKSLIMDLAKKLTEVDMTPDAIAELDSILSGMSLTGKYSISQDDELYASFDGTLVVASAPEALLVGWNHKKEGLTFSIGTVWEKVTGSFLYDAPSEKFSLQVNATASGIEIGNLDGYVMLDKKKVKELSLTLSAEWLTASFVHKNNPDNTFEGKAILPVATMNWTGTTRDGRVTGVFLGGQAVGGNLTMTLTESGTYLSGPLRLTLDGQSLFGADLAIRAEKGILHFLLDIISPELPDTKTHFEAELIYERDKENSIDILPPKDAIPYSIIANDIDTLFPPLPSDDFIDESSVLMPTDTWFVIEEDDSEKDPR